MIHQREYKPETGNEVKHGTKQGITETHLRQMKHTKEQKQEEPDMGTMKNEGETRTWRAKQQKHRSITLTTAIRDIWKKIDLICYFLVWNKSLYLHYYTVPCEYDACLPIFLCSYKFLLFHYSLLIGVCSTILQYLVIL